MPQYFSQEGLDKLKKELDDRETTIRGEIAQRILDAKELGDLSENAEYTEARDAHAINEGKIEELREIIKSAVVIAPHQKNQTVTVGATVRVKADGKERIFTIVGPSESNPSQGFISNEAPLGTALLGRKKGEEVEVLTPGGKMKYRILKIK